MSIDIIFRPLSSANKHRWTIEDQKYLLTNHKLMFVEDMADELGRTVTATKAKAFLMGCSIKSKSKGTK